MTTARTMADVVEQTAADGLPDAPWVGGVGLTLWLLGHAWAVLCCAVLVVTDLREHRLPNRWTLRLALGGVVTAASLPAGVNPYLIAT
ncbi:MAG: hypothetical protein Q4G34_09025, partial [Micrococcus sp.]|nr:hypothetical protein [Micrococcus sp.]